MRMVRLFIEIISIVDLKIIKDEGVRSTLFTTIQD